MSRAHEPGNESMNKSNKKQHDRIHLLLIKCIWYANTTLMAKIRWNISKTVKYGVGERLTKNNKNQLVIKHVVPSRERGSHWEVMRRRYDFKQFSSEINTRPGQHETGKASTKCHYFHKVRSLDITCHTSGPIRCCLPRIRPNSRPPPLETKTVCDKNLPVVTSTNFFFLK